MIVNDVNVINHDNAVVFVTEKNSLTADPRRFILLYLRKVLTYRLEMTSRGLHI